MDNAEELKCHGYNSVKDYLSSIKLDATTALGSETGAATPSRFAFNQLNEQSSKILTGIMLSHATQPNTRPRSTKITQRARPKTGNDKNHQRNQSELLTKFASQK